MLYICFCKVNLDNFCFTQQLVTMFIYTYSVRYGYDFSTYYEPQGLARLACQSMNGDLASILSQDELDFVKLHINR